MPCLNIQRSVGRRGDLLFFRNGLPGVPLLLRSGLYCTAPLVLRIDCAAIGILRSFRYNCRADRPRTLNRYRLGEAPLPDLCRPKIRLQFFWNPNRAVWLLVRFDQRRKQSRQRHA